MVDSSAGWAGAFTVTSVYRNLAIIYRLSNLRQSCGFLIALEDAAFLIGDATPIDALPDEMRRIHNRRLNNDLWRAAGVDEEMAWAMGKDNKSRVDLHAYPKHNAWDRKATR